MKGTLHALKGMYCTEYIVFTLYSVVILLKVPVGWQYLFCHHSPPPPKVAESVRGEEEEDTSSIMPMSKSQEAL